jgi:uncharacterized secreted protein with C-terminal beta-propeller domain
MPHFGSGDDGFAVRVDEPGFVSLPVRDNDSFNFFRDRPIFGEIEKFPLAETFDSRLADAIAPTLLDALDPTLLDALDPGTFDPYDPGLVDFTPPIFKIELLTQPANGTAQISEDGLTILYKPNPGFVGVDEFSYRYVDPTIEEELPPAEGEPKDFEVQPYLIDIDPIIEIDPIIGDPNPGDPGFEVDPSFPTIHKVSVLVEDPWMAIPDWYRAAPGDVIKLDLTANDIPNAGFLYSDAWSLQIVSATSAANGPLEIAGDGQVAIYAAGNATGVDEISYTAIDQDGYTVTGKATLRIAPSDTPDQAWPEMVQQRLFQRAAISHSFSFGTTDSWSNWLWRGIANDAISIPGSGAELNTDPTPQLPDFDGTNNQLAGIEESDRVKTDGNFLYILSAPDHNQLFRWGDFRIALPFFGEFEHNFAQPSLLTVVDVRVPDQPTIVARRLIEDTVVAQDLHGNKLTIIADRNGQTVVTTFDVSNPAEPAQVASTLYSGRYQAGRRVGEKFILVTTEDSRRVPDLGQYPTPIDVIDLPPDAALPYEGESDDEAIMPINFVEDDGTLVDMPILIDDMPPFTGYPYPGFLGGGTRFNETARQYFARVESSLAESMLPHATSIGVDGSIETTYATGFDAARLELLLPTDPLTTYFYMNPTSIISIDTSDFAVPSDWDVTQPMAQVLVTSESIYAVSPFASGMWLDDTSLIERFELAADGLTPVASGTVAGWLLNSFSMDESDGTFRIATTAVSSGTGVYVYEQYDDQLITVGSVENMAPDERIYSVRFAPDRAYVVTFRNVDPLFVIDLTHPSGPKLMGELKVPGYSQYLHIVGPDHVVGIGRDSNPEDGQFGALVISLFDITDPMNPQLQDRYEFAGGRTTFSTIAPDSPWTLTDHHAVSYFAGSRILALPVYTSSMWEHEPKELLFEDPNRSAVFTFKIDTDHGIKPIDRIEFDSRADRTVRIGKHLYSMSSSELKVTELTPGTGEVIASLNFDHRGTDDLARGLAGLPIYAGVVGNDGHTSSLGGRSRVIGAELLSGMGEIELTEDGSGIRFTPESGVVGEHRVRYQTADEEGRLSEAVLTVQSRWDWHNRHSAQDVDGNSEIAPLDALHILNALSKHGAVDTQELDRLFATDEILSQPARIAEGMRHFDVNGDGKVSPNDALLVLNRLGVSQE